MMIQNPFASPRIPKEPYNYEASLLLSMRLPQMLSIVEKSCQTCEKCQVRKKKHYCIEPKCIRKELICPPCDVQTIADSHYMHDHTYVLPLLSRDISNNFYKLKRKVTAYHFDILEEIGKMEEYLLELRKIEGIARGRMQELQAEEESGRIKDYIERMETFLREWRQGDRMSTVLHDVHFKSAQQCLQKEEEIKSELVVHLNALKWPKDPQKVLKEKFTKPMFDDQKREIFISSKKPLELNEIDAHFRTSQEFHTDNLENHRIDIKIEQDYLTKPKFYESFIHHFRNCQNLAIENGTLAHLKTPIAFRRLRQLQFTFTTEMEPQNIKIDNISNQISSLTFRKLREQDAKVLRTIACYCNDLKKIHLEFSNKIDLFSYKELIDFLDLLAKTTLVSFTLKVRTENEVKRLYGYLSKFYRETCVEGWNLGESILQVLQLNPYLTRVVVEGVKPLSMPSLLAKLNRLPFLMDYKIYYENIDLMTELEDRDAKHLEAICYKRKRIFYALAKASKEKRLPKAVITRIAEEMLI